MTVAAPATLVVSEVFGPTVQGEGPHAGRVAAFVRLGGCNLTCSWCDTAYTWDARRFNLRAELSRVDVDQVVSRVLRTGAPLCVVSGGEPLLQDSDRLDNAAFGLRQLLRELREYQVKVDVETNGTIAPSFDVERLVDLFVVSPKLSHAGMPESKRIRPSALTYFVFLARNGRAVFKFVCRELKDVWEVDALVNQLDIPARAVWLMPEGVDAAVLTERGPTIAAAALARGFNFTQRLHVLLWGLERGR